MAAWRFSAAVFASLLFSVARSDDDGFSMWGWPSFGGGDSGEGRSNRGYYGFQNPYGFRYSYNNNPYNTGYQQHYQGNRIPTGQHNGGIKQLSYNRYNTNQYNRGFYNGYNANPFSYLGMGVGMGGDSSGELGGRGGGYNWNGGGYGGFMGGESSNEVGDGNYHQVKLSIPVGGDSSHEKQDDNNFVLPPFGGGDGGSSSQERYGGAGGDSSHVLGFSGGSSDAKSGSGLPWGSSSSSGGTNGGDSHKPLPPVYPQTTMRPGPGKFAFCFVFCTTNFAYFISLGERPVTVFIFFVCLLGWLVLSYSSLNL
ncbi:hypothetical protein PoB_002984200 [Plakobranchus ocellatus]|uniref:Uncharacterized protein n=1 Tax=Plakobranchus ocellatus TaxID=259542 RepID=A0AAV4A7T4_9GAST|nr:hypothetical protein PoB_002984200 [Plakobranchus ocellatus]